MTSTKQLYSIYLFLLLIALPLWAVPIGSSIQQEPSDDCLFSGGFWVCDDASAQFRSPFEQWGVQKVGFPISDRYIHDGFVTQAFQKAIMQWRPESQSVALVNVFDDLHQAGFDYLLLERYQTPRQFPAGWDGELSFDEIVLRRQALLNQRPALREAYFAADEPLTFYGLPTSEVEDMGNHFAIRLQRAVLQEWKEEVPWAAKGEVTIANGADIAKALGALPPTPAPPPPTATLPPSSSTAFFMADVSVIAWAPDSRSLAVAGEQGVRLLSIAGRSPDESLLRGVTASVKTLLFSPDSKRLAAGLEDGTVLLWTLTSNSPPLLLKDHTEAVASLAFSADSRLLASGGGAFDRAVIPPGWPFKDKEVRLWETSSGQLLNILEHEQGFITTLAFTTDRRFVIAATSDQTSGRDHGKASLLAWDIINGERQYKRSVSKPAIFSHQRQLAVSTKQYGSTIKLWQLPTLTEVRTLLPSEESSTGYVHKMTFNQNDTILAALVGSFDFGADRVMFWEVATGNELATLPITDPFAQHPTEPLAISSEKGEVTVWDITQGEEIGSEASQRQVEVQALSFSPDGAHLTILFEDHTFQLLSNWDIPTN
jgi:WD40 repeat protein